MFHFREILSISSAGALLITFSGRAIIHITSKKRKRRAIKNNQKTKDPLDNTWNKRHDQNTLEKRQKMTKNKIQKTNMGLSN